MSNRGIIAKCRTTSSVSMGEIKWKLRPKLDEYFYFIWPTPIKATRNAKAGWLFLAQPDLTHRNKFHATLAPLVKENTEKYIELQAVPETESIETPTNKVQQRVLVLRVPQDECDTMKEFFPEHLPMIETSTSANLHATPLYQSNQLDIAPNRTYKPSYTAKNSSTRTSSTS